MTAFTGGVCPESRKWWRKGPKLKAVGHQYEQQGQTYEPRVVTRRKSSQFSRCPQFRIRTSSRRQAKLLWRLNVKEIIEPPTERCGMSAQFCTSPKRTARFSKPFQGMLFGVVACSDCGMHYVTNPIADTTFIFGNEHLSPNQIKRLKRRKVMSTNHPRHHQTRKLIAEYSRSRTGTVKIVDVGCGNGELLELLTQANYIHAVGYEPYAKRAALCKNKGLDQTRGSKSSTALHVR